MNIQGLEAWADRHPWKFSLGAGLFSGVLFAALFGANLLALIAGVVHTLLHLLAFAARHRRRAHHTGTEPQ